MARLNRVTGKGQVTIPKDVRDALGIRPGDAVAFERGADGAYTVRKAEIDPVEYERRYQAALQAVDEARRRYPMDTFGMTTDEYMGWVREPVPLPDAP